MKKPPSEQKLRGGYYTPASVADFLASWAVRTKSDHVFEPSCGDGVFLEASSSALRAKGASPRDIAKQVQAIELDENVAQEANARLRRLGICDAQVSSGDFFAWCRRFGATRFDAVVGNPPFIRYQHFPDQQREPAFALMRTLGLKPNGLTNAWVPFVSLSVALLNDRGRLGMVIPSELLQVSYSAELRRFLSATFQRITIFTFRELLFKGAQQEVVLLCGERDSSVAPGIDVVELTNASDLERHRSCNLPRRAYKPMDHSTEKWTQYFLSRREISLLRTMLTNDALTPLGQVASVDVGVVTGLNEFFVLTERDRAERSLSQYTTPVVTRSAQLQGIVFDRQAFQQQASQNARSHLLNVPTRAFETLPPEVRSYIREGERKGANLGYKCRIRNHWWVVPSPWIPDGFMLRQIHRYPKISVNESGATCTDTIHRVRLLNGIDAKTLACAFSNSLTFAFSEVFGRSYGGGVLELEPTEAEKLPLPLKDVDVLPFDEVNRLLGADQVDQALDVVDKALLYERVGLSWSEIRTLRGIWQKLMQRRNGRKAQGGAS